MARRPIKDKQVKRLRKALKRKRLPAYMDLVQYLKDHRLAQTTGQAEAIILAGRVRHESHKLGIGRDKVLRKDRQLKALLRPGDLTDDDYEEREVVLRHVPANLREGIQVTP